MRLINKKRLAVTSLLLFLSVSMFSFSVLPGGDSFEIYLNKKLVMQQYVAKMTGPKQLVFNQSNYNDQIDIYYSHCGSIGKDRAITLKDATNKVLKTWKFADAAGNNNAMSCQVKDIMNLQKGTGALQLFYSSKELPGGRLLATVVKGNEVRKI